MTNSSANQESTQLPLHAIRNEQGDEIGYLIIDDGMALAQSKSILDPAQVARITAHLNKIWSCPENFELAVTSRFTYLGEQWNTHFFAPSHYPLKALPGTSPTNCSVIDQVLADLCWRQVDVENVMNQHPWLFKEAVPTSVFVSAVEDSHFTIDKWDMILNGDFGDSIDSGAAWADAKTLNECITYYRKKPPQTSTGPNPFATPPAAIPQDIMLTPASSCVFDVTQVEQQLASIETRIPNPEVRRRMEALYASMINRGAHRTLVTLPDDLEARIVRLREAFPNFGVAIDLVADQLALQRLGNRIVRFEPILLLGSPGIGKTYFAETLARELGTDYRFVHMEAEQNGSTLAGSSEFWSNTRHGELFEYLVHGRSANPLFVIDEIDKVSTREFDARAALYQLLEKETARRFRDLSVSGIELDASNVLWILTANYLEVIPEPLLSRMQVVHVPSPTHAQGMAIASRIYAQLLHSEPWGAHFAQDLPMPVAEYLGRISPRQLKATLMRAFGRAASVRRAELVLGDIVPPTQTEHRSIGFHP